MNSIPVIILFVESALSFYKYFFPRSYSDTSILYLIIGFIFLVTGVLNLYQKKSNRLFQWFVIIFSLIMGPGGYIGIGGISGLLLAIFYLIPKEKSR